MKNYGFDKSQPIKCFIYNGLLYIYEGHTRYAAAVECGLDYVWIYIDGEMTLEQAAKKTIEAQYTRRNAQDSDLVHLFLQLKNQGLSIVEISEKVHRSKRQLYKVQEILSKIDKQTIDELKNSKVTINEVYQRIKAREKKALIEAQKESQKIEQKQCEKIEIAIEVDENSTKEKLEQEQTNKILARQRALNQRELELKDEKRNLIQQNQKKEILVSGIRYGVIGMLKGLPISEILNSFDAEEKIDISTLISEADLNLLNSKLKEVMNG